MKYTVWIRLVLVVILLVSSGDAQAASVTPKDGSEWSAAVTSDELRKVIVLLEDDGQRRELLTLLRAVLEVKSPAVSAAVPKVSCDFWPAALLSALSGSTWREDSVSDLGLCQALNNIVKMVTALCDTQKWDLWLHYTLSALAVGFFCLLAIHASIRRWDRWAKAQTDLSFRFHLWAATRHILVVAIPNILLIALVSFWPPLSVTNQDVTADLALGISFSHALIQHFFVNFSSLYIALTVVATLLIPTARGGRSLLNLASEFSRQLLSFWRIFCVYLAVLIFIRETFLDYFVTGWTYTFSMLILTLPALVILSIRLWRLRAVLWAAPVAASGQQDLVYWFDFLLKKCWAYLSIFILWAAALLSLIQPADGARIFVGRLASTVVVFALVVVGFKVERLLLKKLVTPDTENGRRLLANLDGLLGVGTVLVGGGLILVLWGLPLRWILEYSLTRDILARFLVIGLVVATLVFFIRVSCLATEWLLALPTVRESRNWRTITPLVLTGARSLAVFAATVVILERLGVDVGPILAGAGILGLGVGLGAQSLVKDLINGISILLMDIISVGDSVTIGGHTGTVESVGLRAVRLRDANWNLILIPNSGIEVVQNRTRDLSKVLLDFVAPPDLDPDQVLDLAQEVAKSFNADPEWGPQLFEPASVVGIIAFDSSGTSLRLNFTARAGGQWALEYELRRRLKRRLLEGGFDSKAFAQCVAITEY
ncbi:MAG: mechanosensitive ion channel family protein [Candidatus Adiutrix intracellularis]|jgi:small conductance mechanosensitive channel|nr:mechanosensitive ion channel family protein [Candidatus Adiutrix intracellularis]